MKVEFKKLHENASVPERATEFAGGWDVKVTEIEKISDDFVICYLGFSLAPPSGYKVTFVPRSSLTKTHWIIQNSPCLGDEDFRGQYQLRFRCLPEGIKKTNNTIIQLGNYLSYELTYQEFPFVIGDRVAQMYLESVIPIEFIEVEELSETKRGDGGFGSTNNK